METYDSPSFSFGLEDRELLRGSGLIFISQGKGKENGHLRCGRAK